MAFTTKKFFPKKQIFLHEKNVQVHLFGYFRTLVASCTNPHPIRASFSVQKAFSFESIPLFHFCKTSYAAKFTFWQSVKACMVVVSRFKA